MPKSGLPSRRAMGVRKGGSLGLNSPLELDILQKLYYLRKGDYLFSHTFCLLVCRLYANTTEWICIQILRSIVNGPKSNNYVLVRIWIIVWIQKPTHHFLQIFLPLRMFKIVFRDTSLYPKQLSSICLLWLISASADRIGYIIPISVAWWNCCTSSKTIVFNTEAFRHLIMSQQAKRKLKVCWTSIHHCIIFCSLLSAMLLAMIYWCVIIVLFRDRRLNYVMWSTRKNILVHHVAFSATQTLRQENAWLLRFIFNWAFYLNMQ